MSDEDKAKLQQVASLDELMKKFAERLGEQHERHEGGNRWIGTGGTSPFGNGGFHPGGIRVGGESGNRSAAKVWEQRSFRDLDGDAELGPRNLKLALRRLRKFAREGAAEEFDLDGTIAATAREGGLLDVRMRPERRNAVSVILLLDVGGSMDEHVHAAKRCSARRVPSSSGWRPSTSTTSCTNRSGAAAVSMRPGRCPRGT
jgi:uncharacterized protein with von Willebrand factor type A (vWA) domain